MSVETNYRNIGYREIKTLLNTNNNYSLGEVIYSILRLEDYEMRVKDIKNISDKRFYELIEKAKTVEDDSE